MFYVFTYYSVWKSLSILKSYVCILFVVKTVREKVLTRWDFFFLFDSGNKTNKCPTMYFLKSVFYSTAVNEQVGENRSSIKQQE